MAEARGILLRLWTITCWTNSDTLLLGRILRNLVINAVQHTDRGCVLVAVRRRGDRYRIEVRDSGKGIPPDLQRLIFEEFRQVDNPERNRTKGQGLGLAIVSLTADLLGHRLFLRSIVGKGSVFAIEVPALTAPENGPQTEAVVAVPPASIRHAHILVIEDDGVQASSLKTILTDNGHHVTIANSVAVALALRLERLDLIISDYRLSGGINGLDGIAKIRERYGIPIPALLLTGDTHGALATEAAVAGCDILHKPCFPIAVLNATSRLIMAHAVR